MKAKSIFSLFKRRNYSEFIMEVTSRSYLLPTGERAYQQSISNILHTSEGTRITVGKGDSINIDWVIEFRYDESRNVVSIYNNGEYKGTISGTDGYRSEHHLHGEYRRS